MKNLGHIQTDQVFWEATEIFRNRMQGAIFTVPGAVSIFLSSISRGILENDVQSLHRLHESMVLDNVRVLRCFGSAFLNRTYMDSNCPSYIQVLQQINFQLQRDQ